MSRFAVLIGEINHGLADLDKITCQTQALLKKVEVTADDDYLGTIALNVHSFYSGAERIFRDIASSIDNALPEGADWHRRLLRQMDIAVPDIRPAVLSEASLKQLDELCRFRHVVRNVYAFELVPERVNDVATELPNCLLQLERDLSSFCEFLVALNGSLSGS